MPQELVRAVIDDQQVTVSRAYAEKKKLTVLAGEPTATADGRPRGVTTTEGRPLKPRTSVEEEAAKKAAESTEPATREPAAGRRSTKES